jgi:hypothetical protein
MALNAQKSFETGNGFQIVLTFKLTGMSLDFTLSQVSGFTSKSRGGGGRRRPLSVTSSGAMPLEHHFNRHVLLIRLIHILQTVVDFFVHYKGPWKPHTMSVAISPNRAANFCSYNLPTLQELCPDNCNFLQGSGVFAAFAKKICRTACISLYVNILQNR